MKTHEFESTIVGYHKPVPSGKGWLPIGYSKPIFKYTCKVCGYFTYDGFYLLLNPEPCPGSKEHK